MQAVEQLFYEYESEQPPLVAENARQHWKTIKDKVSKLLKFAEEVNDEVHRLNGEEDALGRSEHAAPEQNHTSYT